MKNITTPHTFSYTHISNGYFYLSVKVFPHAWKMFNYFCVSYRGMVAATSISPIFHSENVSKREPTIIYLYSRWTAIVQLTQKNFHVIFKFNEINGILVIVYTSAKTLILHSPNSTLSYCAERLPLLIIYIKEMYLFW